MASAHSRVEGRPTGGRDSPAPCFQRRWHRPRGCGLSNPVAPWTLDRVPERARANRKPRTPVVTSPDAPAATWHPSKKRLGTVLEPGSELSRMRTGIIRIGLEPSESEPSALLPSGFAAAMAESAVDLWDSGAEAGRLYWGIQNCERDMAKAWAEACYTLAHC